jgi:hypothetical protein
MQPAKGGIIFIMEPKETTGNKAPWLYVGGKLYISHQFERKLFFGLTVLGMLWGALTKVGIL